MAIVCFVTGLKRGRGEAAGGPKGERERETRREGAGEAM